MYLLIVTYLERMVISMKKLLALMLALSLAFSLAACGDSNTPPPSDSPTPVQTESSTPPPSDDGDDPGAPTDDPGVPTDGLEGNTDDTETSNSEWKEFLRLYEEWVDDYIELLKKYNANPLDLSLIADYIASTQKLIEWSEQADKIESDLSSDDVIEYLATLSRILEKLSAFE